jgi:hypothetical protein
MSAIFISHSSQDNAAADRVQRALKDAHHHATFLDSDPEQGIPPGRDWEDVTTRDASRPRLPPVAKVSCAWRIDSQETAGS